MPRRDITHQVQRLEVFEDRLDVRIEAVYASIDGPDIDGEYKIELNGEIHKVSGTDLDGSIKIVLSVYDDQGRIRETYYDFITPEEFFGFHVFSISFYTEFAKPTRLQLVPKPG